MRLLRNRLKLVEKSYPDIVTQLGCSMSQDPGAELKALYVQLLVGLDLVALGNTYPGYAMVHNDGLGSVEHDLIKANADRLIESAKGSHHYWRTAVMTAMSKARRRYVILKPRIEWVGCVDPCLSAALSRLGMPFVTMDCAALAVHWHAEQEAGRAIETFPQAYYDSLRGDSLEDTAQRSGKAGT